jgi:arginine/serine-rich splicing factor 4/5/6
MEESAVADPASDNKVSTTGGDSDDAEVKAGGEASVEKDEKKGCSENGVGSPAMRPIFLGNLKHNYQADDITSIFQKPLDPPGSEPGAFRPIAVERLDQKRGYCFVFLKDAESAADKDNAERYITAISGMEVENVSSALRAECARGDGRIKRKEDDRRKNIKPSDTLFVVNFQEETTKREDLKMLFEPFGELVRIDMKRNYAFVQFKNVDEATKAKEATNGGQLEQSVLTVEYVARQRNRNDDSGGGGRRGRYNRRDDRGGRYRDDRYRDDRRGRRDDFRGGDRGSSMDYDDRGRRDDFRGGRDRSPYRGGSPGRGGDYRRRSRSRSRSPPRGGDYRRDDRGGGYSRSPPRGRYDDRDRGRMEDYRDGVRGSGRYDDDQRGRSPDMYRGNDRGRDDRGYRY